MSDVVRPTVDLLGQTEKEQSLRGEHSGHRQHARAFQVGTDPDLLWLGPTQQQILDRLRSGVLTREGVLVLTGGVGTGKTILAKALLRRLRPDATVATVIYAWHDPLDFLKEIGDAWGVDSSPATLEAFYSRLPALLDDAVAHDKRLVLFVDEAQALHQDLLAEIGRLAVMAGEPRSQARLSILLVGQDELETVLSRPENAALAERIGVRCVTTPLTDTEVGEYAAHQLILRGPGPVFTDEGLRELAAASQGIPRLINTIARLALLSGSQQGTPTIGAEVVRQCALGSLVGQPDEPAREVAEGAGARPDVRLDAVELKAPEGAMQRRREPLPREASVRQPRESLEGQEGGTGKDAAHDLVPVADPLDRIVRAPAAQEPLSREVGRPQPAHYGRGPRPRARQQRHTRRSARGAALYVVPVVLVLALVLGGYLYDAARHDDSRPAPAKKAMATVAPAPERPAANGGTGLEAARVNDAAPLTPLETRRPDADRPAVEPPRERPVTTPPESLSPRQARPRVARVTEARPASDAPATPPVSRSEQTSAVQPTGLSGRSSEVRAGDDSQAVDPGAIIDWLLQEYPARRQ